MITTLEKGWLFTNTDDPHSIDPAFDDSNWDSVEIPHDWAIYGPFDKANDAQVTQVHADGETEKHYRYGRTGGLPHVGVGWYRKKIEIPSACKNRRILIEFDGAMSHARVFLNGAFVGEWPYGYASFGFDLTPYIQFGQENTLAIRLANLPEASRWYPGAGLYRNVRLVVTGPVHVGQWGTYITTPTIAKGIGNVNIKTIIVSHLSDNQEAVVVTKIFDSTHSLMDSMQTSVAMGDTFSVEQNLHVQDPTLWSVEQPALYRAFTEIFVNNELHDTYETVFGFRHFHFDADSGFYLNNERLIMKGVCLHHDLGPLGAAVNTSAIRRQLNILKEMGCNAIRTSHNPPTPELLDLCDEMGFVVIDEAFDEWKRGKVRNGYNRLFDEWAEKDLVALIHRDRNHPSVIMWSIGNEILEQWYPDGAETGRFLAEICRREDPTRPVTAGFNGVWEPISNGLVESVDIPAWNYKPDYYAEVKKKYPEWKMYASETASTVSSRGKYYLPAVERIHYTREPYHCSAFDMEFPRWASSPDKEFAAQDDNPFMAGEFVWTGFDYLGEPTPYNEQWPSRSSYFGIVDLCGIPKDRYYLYQSRWSNKEVLHLLPHWNWEGREGKPVSVHCYTSFNEAELFVNGKSMGKQTKDPKKLYGRYRLIWDNALYKPGELKVVVYNEQGQELKSTSVFTAGEPAKIQLIPDRMLINATGKDLAFVTVEITDEAGNVCPNADNLVLFEVEGEGRLRAVGNGDPTSLESFQEPHRRAFSGKCMAIVESTETAGQIILKARSEGLQGTEAIIQSKN